MRQSDTTLVLIKGYFNIAGRIKDMIIRGGENIYYGQDSKVQDAPAVR